jgi:hypothetical protein
MYLMCNLYCGEYPPEDLAAIIHVNEKTKLSFLNMIYVAKEAAHLADNVDTAPVSSVDFSRPLEVLNVSSIAGIYAARPDFDLAIGLQELSERLLSDSDSWGDGWFQLDEDLGAYLSDWQREDNVYLEPTECNSLEVDHNGMSYSCYLKHTNVKYTSGHLSTKAVEDWLA